MKTLNLLTKGNSKLDKSILGWSITPIKSCLNCNECKKSCYAVKSYNRWPAVKTAWERNFRLAKSGEFKAHVISQIQRSRTVSAVRIHVAGDFFNQGYINTWAEIAQALPNIKFYGYSKVFEILDLAPLVALPNVNIINSIASDGGINYGDVVRINKLIKLGYRVCPATVKGQEVHCGGEGPNSCKLCQINDKVCFHIH